MPLKYFPLIRVVTNRYTGGDEFVLPDGKFYKGRYYTTYTGESFTGVNPILGTNLPLIPYSLIRSQRGFASPKTSSDNFIPEVVAGYNAATDQELANSDRLLKELTPYYPVVTEDDYQRGYFTRYFAKNISGPGYIFEISRLDWSKIQNGEVENNVLGYETADILWQLTGPLNNKRISQYQIQGGVYDTNKRVTEGENKTFRGLVEFIGGDYTKFARITP